MKLFYRGKHTKRRMLGLIGAIVLAALALSAAGGMMAGRGFRQAQAVALEKPRVMGADPVIASFVVAQHLLEIEEYAAAAADENAAAEPEAVDKHPVYTKQYDDVGADTVYLTIDDGPSKNTERILDILSAYQVKATFFMLEPAMNQYGAEVTRMQEDGHAVGMHGVSHRKEVVYASAESVVGEMLTGQSHIAELTGVTTPLFRPPYGSKPYMTEEYREAVSAAGLSMWDWNVDSLDWKFRSKEYVKHTIKQLEHLKERGKTPVILIHDTEKTAEFLPLLLEYLQKQGYQFALPDQETEPIQFPL